MNGDEFLDYLAKNLVDGSIKITKINGLELCAYCQKYMAKYHICIPPVAMVEG